MKAFICSHCSAWNFEDPTDSTWVDWCGSCGNPRTDALVTVCWQCEFEECEPGYDICQRCVKENRRAVRLCSYCYEFPAMTGRSECRDCYMGMGWEEFDSWSSAPKATVVIPSVQDEMESIPVRR
jgi:hypothetical protein